MIRYETLNAFTYHRSEHYVITGTTCQQPSVSQPRLTSRSTMQLISVKNTTGTDSICVYTCVYTNYGQFTDYIQMMCTSPTVTVVFACLLPDTCR